MEKRNKKVNKLPGTKNNLKTVRLMNVWPQGYGLSYRDILNPKIVGVGFKFFVRSVAIGKRSDRMMPLHRNFIS